MRLFSRIVLFDLISARTHRASSLTPSASTSNMNNPSTKNAKSIDDLIETLNHRSETPKSNSRKKFERPLVVSQQSRSYFSWDRSSSSSAKSSSKKSSVTKELEDLMESLTNFKLPAEVRLPFTLDNERSAIICSGTKEDISQCTCLSSVSRLPEANYWTGNNSLKTNALILRYFSLSVRPMLILADTSVGL